MSTRVCNGCKAPDAKETEWGHMCPRCEVVMLRYNSSLTELNTFVKGWQERWVKIGLSEHEASEHLKGAMLRVGRKISPELGTG